ncbi:MAG: FtsX-like permease family protein, partial [Trebonia sp.]
FHQVAGHSTGVVPSPLLVGTFNPGRLRGFSQLSRVPLQTFYPPVASAGDRAAKRLLGGKPLGPTTNLGGYLSQPPLLLTTIQGAVALDNGDGDRAEGVGAYAGASPAAPLSSVQVRVRGVTGPNALSLARIKLVAEQIQSRTGLTVDVTAGSSPTDVPVELQAGKYGQPRLRLVQGWVKEDVDSAIVQALSGKDLSLIVVLSLACCLFVGAAAFAGVRQRRREIAILGTIGWRARTIFGLVLSETTLTGLVGGALACALTIVIASVGSLDIPAVRLALIIPVAGAVALIAGAVPAFSAARMTPLDALRPPAVRARRARRVHGVPSLALANLVRSPGRSLVAVVTLALAVATLNVLVGIQVAFHGAVAGDLLGQVVSVNVRHVDTISTLMVLIVAVGGVADVLLTSLRERGRELGALLACGWSERDITHLVVYEAAGIGVAGSILGAVVGVVVIASLNASAATAVATVLIVAAAGVALTVLATALPFARASRRAPASLIATTDE